MQATKSGFVKHALIRFGLCLLLVLPSLALAQSFTAADRSDIANFTLTTDVLQRMQAVTKDGQAMHAKHRALDISKVHSLDDMAAQMTDVDPRVKPMLASHGFTPHQFVVANLALVNAVTTANAQNNPQMAGQVDKSTYNAANVAFYEAHRDVINAMMQQAGGG